MIQEAESRKSPAEVPASEGTWIQITFTLDPEHYRTLWQRADEEHRTIPAFVRETVIDFLDEPKILSREGTAGFKKIPWRK